MVEIIEVSEERKRDSMVKHEMDGSYKADSGLDDKEETEVSMENAVAIAAQPLTFSFSSGYESSKDKIEVKWNDVKIEAEQRISEPCFLQSSNVKKGKRICDISSIEHVSFMPKTLAGKISITDMRNKKCHRRKL